MMDWQTAFNILFALFLAMGGWITGRISKTLDQFDADLRKLPDKYVSKHDFNRSLDKIERSLERIEQKLDMKEDKDR